MGRNAAIAFVVLALLPLAHGKDEPAPRPALENALEAMGIGAKDLGYRPKAHWPRYPHSKTVPYVMPFFDDLLANPLDTYMFTRTLGNAIEDMLTPELLRAAPKKGGKETLYKLGIMLATERRIGGFRVFGIDTSQLGNDVGDPFAVALSSIPRAHVRGDVGVLPKELKAPLGRLLLDLVDAREWIERGLRHVSESQRRRVFEALPRLSEDTPDGTKYYPVFDDVAKVIDEHSLHFGCLKALQAVQNARRAIGAVPVPESGWPPFRVGFRTEWGTVEFNSTDEPSDVIDPFLIVDFGAARRRGPLGATSPHQSLSVALLMGAAPVGARDFASGICGCGIVYEASGTDTVYESKTWGQGAGLFGLGVLIDEGGNDVYEMRSCGQGAAFFGAGLLLDAAGDDKYVLREGDGQGFGGPNGIGILADRSGDDFYYAEPDASKAGRADYHSKHEIAVSNAQGVGSGRRGDLTDGHVWAGGLGALIDVEGDDRYRAGNFSQGLGYWYGTGLMWDGGGDDQYRSVYFTQGSGAHFAIGALIDEGGNDEHLLENNAGAAFAFGWDVVNAFLIDRGNGNDRYEAERISLGVAQVRSNAFFIDEGGDDIYVTKKKGMFFGNVDKRGFEGPSRTSDFMKRLGQVGVFLDLGGKDQYLGVRKDGTFGILDRIQNDRRWHYENSRRNAFGAPNAAIGVDTENATLDFLKPWPRRVGAGR